MNENTTPATLDTESGTAKVRIRPDLSRYVRDKSGNGKRTHRTDDFVARVLAGKSIDEIKQGAVLLGIDVAKWEALNPGQQRMLIGNKIRHLLLGAKPTLDEAAVTDVYGEPVPEAAEAAAEGEPEPATQEEAAVEQPVEEPVKSRKGKARK